MIAILIAIEEELSTLKNKIKIIKEEIINSKRFYFFNFNQKEYVLVESGIGLVNASIATSIVSLKYKPDYIINFGSAGGTHKSVEVFDLILASQAFYFDFQVIDINNKVGQVPRGKLFFKASKKLINNFQKILEREKILFKLKTIGSGSTFISKNSFKNFPSLDNNNAFCADMELAGILHTAEALKVPTVSFKFISDNIYSNDSSFDFDENISKIGELI